VFAIFRVPYVEVRKITTLVARRQKSHVVAIVRVKPQCRELAQG